MTKVQERGAVQIQPKSFDGVKTAQKGYAYLLKESKLDSASFSSSVKANGGVIKRLMKAVVGFGIGVGSFVLSKGKKNILKNVLTKKRAPQINETIAKGVKGQDDSGREVVKIIQGALDRRKRKELDFKLDPSTGEIIYDVKTRKPMN